MSHYEKDGDELILSAETYRAEEPLENEEKETYNGIAISYNSYTGKYVPADYEKTEQDILDEAEGKVIISYGTDEIEIYEVQGVGWIQDGIRYNITAMNSPLDEQGLINMAMEMIDF